MSAAAIHDSKQLGWGQLAPLFIDERACIAAFMALETAEILDGVKPANLINVVNRPQPCGRNLYLLWKKYGDNLLVDSGLTPSVMIDRGESLLLLVYRDEAFTALLSRPNVMAVLRRAGYQAPLDKDSVLAELGARLQAGRGFPHEIGVFLGYPLKDVAAFMGWVSLPFSCQRLWKIYGDPRRSLQLAHSFSTCRNRMAHRLVHQARSSRRPCKHPGHTGGHPFLCATN
ncbi:DUF3793 family protein [Desulfuromonas sp. AOP6]|uniref:DUF3793 family protein n=1 Tax=Desulfuromonas sp. AOP6 TaxID=1566351 RepID=UPI0012709B1A|nr:DUF3793 family protein [Desulfuromonas sp. AOP6]BCA78889.1 hypothetical protein AOP6_0676 [Desulfuromonas sp. AOP6]